MVEKFDLLNRCEPKRIEERTTTLFIDVFVRFLTKTVSVNIK